MFQVYVLNSAYVVALCDGVGEVGQPDLFVVGTSTLAQIQNPPNVSEARPCRSVV